MTKKHLVAAYASGLSLIAASPPKEPPRSGHKPLSSQQVDERSREEHQIAVGEAISALCPDANLSSAQRSCKAGARGAVQTSEKAVHN
jgi:hypothetical protein